MLKKLSAQKIAPMTSEAPIGSHVKAKKIERNCEHLLQKSLGTPIDKKEHPREATEDVEIIDDNFFLLPSS